MKITAPASTWATIFNVAKKHTSSDHAVRLSVSGGQAWVGAKGLVSTLALKLPAGHASGAGTVYVPPNRIYQTAKSLSGGPMTLRWEEGADEAEISSGSGFEASFAIGGRVEVDLPSAPDGPDETWSAASLRGALERTLPATSSNDADTHLQGVCLDLPSGTVAATDEKILSCVGLGDETGWRETLPEPACERLLGVLPESGDVDVVLGERTFFASWEGGTLSARLLAATEEFPEYQRVVPSEDPPVQIHCERGLLVDALRRVSAYVSDEEGYVRMEWNGTALVMRGGEMEAGCGAHEKVPVTAGHTDTGGGHEGLLANVSTDYLLAQLKAYGADTVALAFRGTERLMSVIPAPEKNSGATAGYIMPMRVKDSKMQIPA